MMIASLILAVVLYKFQVVKIFHFQNNKFLPTFLQENKKKFKFITDLLFKGKSKIIWSKIAIDRRIKITTLQWTRGFSKELPKIRFNN